MSFSVLVVDPAVPTDSVTTWPLSAQRLGFVHPGALDLAVRWVREQGCAEVLVLTRPRSLRRAQTVATTVAGALPGCAAHVVARETTMLTMAMAGSAALELGLAAPQASAAALASVDASVGGALLHRLSRLDVPRPSMWQHLTSLFGRRHVALVGAPGSVHRADRTIEMPDDATLLVAAEEGSPEYAAVVAALQPPGATHPVPPILPTSATFGSAGTEFVAFVTAAGPSTTGECRVCTHPTSSPVCPFCRVRTTPQEITA